MTTTPNMLLVLPTLGGSSGTWDDLSQAIHERIDLHDHATGKGVKVKPAGLDINADLTFAGLWAPTNLKAVQFTAQEAYTVARSLFVLSIDNELYWRNQAGVNVKVTNGTGLNMSLVGGIVGDYSSTTAAVYYEDAGKRYKMLQNGPAPDFWASVDCGDLKLYQKASGISNKVTLQSPGALAASYALSFPAALPVGEQLAMQCTSGGLLVFSNTFTKQIAAGAGVLCSADQDVTISGTGQFRHGHRELSLPPFLGHFSDASWSVASGHYIVSTGSAIYNLGLPLHEGDRIDSVYIKYYGDGVADLTAVLYRSDSLMGLVSVANATIINPPAAWATATLSINVTVLGQEGFVLTILANTANLRIGTITVYYSHP